MVDMPSNQTKLKAIEMNGQQSNSETCALHVQTGP